MHLRNVIRLLGQALEDLPPQQGYPEFSPDRYNQETIPEPIGYVYHVSPYAQEILDQGFVIDPTKTTLGAFGDLHSVSTTNYENAKKYKEGIQVVVGVANGELTTKDLAEIIGPNIKEAIQYFMREELVNFWNTCLRDVHNKYGYSPEATEELNRITSEIFPEEYGKYEEVYNFAHKELDDYIATFKDREPTEEEVKKFNDMHAEVSHMRPIDVFPKSEEGKDWLYNICINDLDFYGNVLSEEEILERRWKILKAAAFYTDIPVVCGIDIPEHLKDRKMSDVGIVEVAVAPTEFTVHPPDSVDVQMDRLERTIKFMEESNDYTKEDIDEYIANYEIEDPKGKYTYNIGEQEWKFFDPTDLWPIRLVSHGNYL